jgi:predicted MFS family arabinose efflux permease
VRLEPYRQVLALPGVRPLLLTGLVARVPATAMAVTVTLHVVESLKLGYGAAGMVGAAMTIGAAAGAPLLGRLVDRRGLRLVLVITALAEGLFWAVAPDLPYAALLAASVLAGFLSLPVFSIVRQSVAALVPVDQRRQAYAMDAMSVELSFMTGPVLAVLLVQEASSRVAMYAIGVAMLTVGAAMFRLNPAVRSAEELEHQVKVPRREWLTPRLLAVLAMSAATTCVLAGTDVAVIAELRATGDDAWIGVALGVWGSYSLVGGFLYGAMRRPIAPAVLLALLGLLTMPVGLADGALWITVAMLGAGALCAPTLTATSELVSRIVPAAARGEAMGWHGSSLTVGLAAGAPIAGAVMDATSPAWGFTSVGAVAVLVALALWPINRRIAAAEAVAAAAVKAAAEAGGREAVVAREAMVPETTSEAASEAIVPETTSEAIVPETTSEATVPETTSEAAGPREADPTPATGGATVRVPT